MVPPLRIAIIFAPILLAIAPARAQDARRATTGSEPAYALVTTAAKHVRDELTFEVVAPDVRATDWVVYMPRIPELPSQTDVRSALFPGGRSARELSAMGRPVLYARIPVRGTKGRDGVTIRVEYEANLLERRLVRREPGAKAPPPAAPLPPKERRLALAEGHQFDFRSSRFQGWLDAHKLRREPNESEVDFARRVFLEIKGGFKIVPGADQYRLASHVCEGAKSDGCGLSIVFVSALRANGIPARVASGRWARELEPGQKANAADEPQVKAEFFATGVGWVPVDVGCAILLDESPGGLEYFGTDNADFLTMHFDTDLEFDSVFFGRKTIEFVQAPAFWVAGSGTMSGFKLTATSRIDVESLDLSRPFPKPGARRPEPTAKSRQNSKGKAPTPSGAGSSPGTKGPNP
jgi:Transglutaminase-like superfamily